MPINYADAIRELADEIYKNNDWKGYWDDDIDPIYLIQSKLLLIGTEVSEAEKVHRTNYDDSDIDLVTRMTDMQEIDFTDEIADIIIRSLDLAGGYDLDIGTAIVKKIEKNKIPDKSHYRY